MGELRKKPSGPISHLYTSYDVFLRKKLSFGDRDDYWGRSILICLSVGLSICPRGYLQKHTHDLYQFFCACCLWPWLGPPPSLR